MSDEMECQHHANCGGYASTEAEVDQALCEDCLESYKDQEKHQEALKRLAKALRDFDQAESEDITAALAKMLKAAREVVKIDG